MSVRVARTGSEPSAEAGPTARTSYRRALLEQWLLLEADPAVTTFCERPGYVHVERQQRLADFWVCYVDRQELVILGDSHYDEKMPRSHRPLDGAALPIRRSVPADLAAARVWIDNRQRMLPCIVANWGLVSPSLPRVIACFLTRPRKLLAIEREFSTADPVWSARPCSACCMPDGSVRRICTCRRYPCSLRLSPRRQTYEPPQAGVSGN